MNALVLSNPIAGNGTAGKKALALIARLEERGVRCTHVHTERRALARSAASERAHDHEVVVAVGGDGTMNAVLEGLPPGPPPLALLPAGTANLLAHEFGLPTSGEGCAEVILAGATQPLDLLRIGERVSFLVTGVGLDAAVVRAVDLGRRGPITKASYALPILRALVARRPPRLRVRLDDGPWQEASQVFFANLRVLGSPWLRFAEPAVHGDGLVESYQLRGRSRCAYLRWALGFLRGRVGRTTWSSFARVRSADIDSDQPVPFQIDGDYAGTTPIHLEVAPEALALMVPARRTAS